jgi:hypothetical protein
MVIANALSWGADNFFPILKGIAIVGAGIAGLGKLYDGSRRRKRQAEAVRIGRPELLRQLTVALTALHERELHNEAGDDEAADAGDRPAFDPSGWDPPQAEDARPGPPP